MKYMNLGIIGYGNIGQAVARLAVAFGMNVIAYGHHGIKEELLTEHVRSVSLEELYKESDVISLHCPLTKENMAMIRKDNNISKNSRFGKCFRPAKTTYN